MQFPALVRRKNKDSQRVYSYDCTLFGASALVSSGMRCLEELGIWKEKNDREKKSNAV